MEPSSSQEFPARLRAAITASQQSLEEVARAAGLGGRQSLHPYLTGRVEPTLKRVEQLASVLHVDRRWLAGWHDKGGPLRGVRRPLTDNEWEKALRAYYRSEARRAEAARPEDPAMLRPHFRKVDRQAEHAARHARLHHENQQGVAVLIPLRKRSYRVKKILVLQNSEGEVARIRAYPHIYSGERMRVISSRD